VRTGLSAGLWPVHESYKLDNVLIRPVGASGYERHFYYPLAHANLPFELAKVKGPDPRDLDDPRDYRSALEFVTKWGLLGYTEETAPEAPSERFNNGDLIFLIWGHAYTVRNVLSLVKALGEEDHAKLGRVLTEIARQEGTKEGTGKVEWVSWQQMHRGEERLETRGTYFEKKPDSDELALTIIAKSLSANLPPLHPRVSPLPKGQTPDGATPLSRLSRQFMGMTLIGAIYWHLANLVMGEHRIAICEECTGFFEQTDPRQRFCPPPPQHFTEAHSGMRSRAQSLCGLRYRKRQQRSEQGAQGRLPAKAEEVP
jgi:hypothetical protein